MTLLHVTGVEYSLWLARDISVEIVSITIYVKHAKRNLISYIFQLMSS